MSFWRTFSHIITLGIVPSNKEYAKIKAERERRKLPCQFTSELTQEMFTNLAIHTARPIKRLSVTTKEALVICEVRSNSGITTWSFCLDFNDYGKITGKYRIRYNHNSDSIIPQSYAEQLKAAIIELNKSTTPNSTNENV